MATFTGQAGTNNTFVGSAVADTFLWAVADLNNLDTATGGGGADVLRLTTAGGLAQNALAGISGIPTIQLAAGTNGITLVNGNLTGVAGARIAVVGNTGNDTIDASGLTGTNAVLITAGTGTDRLTGGAGADTFRFAAAALNGDTINGGLGSDRLELTTAGTVTTGLLSRLTAVETIQLAAGSNAIALADVNLTGVAGARIAVIGSTGNDSINASALTGANAVLINSGAGTDNLRGGAGADIFRFTVANLTGDIVTGGLGNDLLELTTAGTITTVKLSRVSGVETIQLAAGSNAIALTNANMSGVAGARIAVTGSTGNDSINASALTGANAVLITSGAGTDNLRGGAGNDTFRFTAADLTADIVTGGLGNDLLELTTAGTITTTKLSRVTGVETIQLAAGSNAIALTNANMSGVAGARIAVIGNSGNDSINASALTGANAVLINSGAGTDNLRGGAGNDTFRFTAADLNGDTINGGLGSDRLELTAPGTVTAGQLLRLTAVETIQLAAGTNSITLIDANMVGLAGGLITVHGGSGNDTINAAQLAGTNRLVTVSGGGLDVLTGGAGNDLFFFAPTDLNGDTINGALGSDRLQLTTAGTITAEALAGMTGVETIQLANGTNSITLGNTNLTGLAGGLITVNGGSGDDTINAAQLTGTNRLLTVSGGGLDVLTGGAGSDLFFFAPTDLNGDTITGGGGNDRLQLAAAGTVTAAALAGMSGVETIQLANGTNSIALGDANFAGVANSRITVLGGSGNDTVTALTATTTNAIDVTAGAGNDTLTGSVGSDIFRFAAADLTSADTVQGSGGFADTLQLTTAGNASLTGVTGIEQINLAAGNNLLVLLDANYAVPLSFGPTIFVNGASGSSIINALLLSAPNAMVYSGGGGLDGVTGGAGADRFVYSNGRRFVAGSTLNGGGGTDTISFDRSMDFLGDDIRGIEVLQSTSTAGVAVAISGQNAARFTQFAGSSGNGATDTFTVQLIADSATDLSNLTLANRDAADAINVVSLGGAGTFNTVVLSSAIASFTGGAGDDKVVDRGGVKAIALGGGDDLVVFEGGNLFAADDTIDGGAGTDFILFDRSMDFLGDTITNVEILRYTGSGAANVTISGENAARIAQIDFEINSSRQVFTIQLSAGSTTDLSNLTVINAEPRSIVFIGDRVDVVSTSGNTTVTLSSAIDGFTGSAGNDTVGFAPGGGYKVSALINGGEGNDRIAFNGIIPDTLTNLTDLDGGVGNDTLVLTGGATIELANASDQLDSARTKTVGTNFENVDASASTGGVRLTGRNDVASILIGSSAADTITAGEGGAEITGGLGGDTLTGGVENERFFFNSTAEAAGDTIDGGGGGYDSVEVLGETNLSGAAISNIDALVLGARDAAGTPINANVNATLAAAQAAALADVYGNGAIAGTVETLVVNASAEALDLSTLNFFNWGSEDRVVINGTSFGETITGTSQNDMIFGDFGGDSLRGDSGDDVLGYDYGQTNFLDGGVGIDTLKLMSIQPGAVSISVNLALGSNNLIEDDSNDALDYTLSAADFENADFSLNLASTTLIGTDADNTLIGGSAADTITGGLGADTLTGGGGADSFVWNVQEEGGDTITDFEQGADKLVFSSAAFGFTNASFDRVNNGFSSSDDLFVFVETYSITELREALIGFQFDSGKNAFFVAPDLNGRQMLYYSPSIGSLESGIDAELFYVEPELFQIADLGAGPAPGLSDFVFV